MAEDTDRPLDALDLAKRLGEMEDGYEQFRRRALRIANWMRRILIGNVIIGLAVAGLGTYGYVSLRDLAHRNRQGIHVSCVLLSNAIIQSGASNPPSSAQARLSAIYVRAIVRGLTPAEAVEARSLAKLAQRPAIQLPSCDDVALHPENVRALDLTQHR